MSLCAPLADSLLRGEEIQQGMKESAFMQEWKRVSACHNLSRGPYTTSVPEHRTKLSRLRRLRDGQHLWWHALSITHTSEGSKRPTSRPSRM